MNLSGLEVRYALRKHAVGTGAYARPACLDFTCAGAMRNKSHGARKAVHDTRHSVTAAVASRATAAETSTLYDSSGAHRTCFGFLPSFAASSSIVPYSMQNA